MSHPVQPLDEQLQPVDEPGSPRVTRPAGHVPRRVRRGAGPLTACLVLAGGAVAAAVFGPNSWATPALLTVAFVLAAVALVRVRAVATRLLAGAGALLSAMALGIVVVNSYYSYYDSWGALWADVSADNGVSAAPALIPVVRPGAVSGAPRGQGRGPIQGKRGGQGRLLTVLMPGPVSGVNGRGALIWLPPEYDEPSYRTTRFPVLELLHGDPGGPRSWVNGLNLPAVLDREYATGTSMPMIVVMPDVHGAFEGQQCLDIASGPRLDTYLTQDVPAGLAAQVRSAPTGRRWAVGGLSEGAFCAARLALRNPTSFGAVAVMDGYFHTDVTGGLRRRLYQGGRVPTADDPTELLKTMPSSSQLPAFWIMAGTGNAQDYHNAIAFATRLGHRQDLRFLTVIGGRHTTAAWRMAFPDLLRWAAAAVSGHPTYGQTSVRG